MIRTTQFRMSRQGIPLDSFTEMPEAQLVMAFGSGELLHDSAPLSACRQWFPEAHVLGCSTAGSIFGSLCLDEEIVVTASHFEHTRLKLATASLEGGSRRAGQNLAEALAGPELRHVLVLSEGLHVNGTELIEGLTTALPASVSVSGGLAGDGERMSQTVIVSGLQILRDKIAGVGFYGSRLKVGCGCEGGWGPLGPEREITRSKGNVLYELDGQDALALYRLYLGEHAAGLPSAGLLFPLQVRPADNGAPVVRTLLGIDEESGGIRFAGDIAQGHFARLMTASFGRLVDGARSAAEEAASTLEGQPELTLLVSCVGRRMLMRQRSDQELEAVRECGEMGAVTGFYSYGELSPAGTGGCEMHNQTMTVTAFREI